MNPYIGDRQLEPDEHPENICEYCDGIGAIGQTYSNPCGEQCPECLGTGIAESPEHLTDPGEPNDYPED